MPTKRLYLSDSFLRRFDAVVDGRGTYDGRHAVTLTESAFYPEGGGQLGDHGTLDVGGHKLSVVDVQIDDDGVVHHVLDREAPADVVGRPVHGEIDWTRRRAHMSQHTAQHVLSASLASLCSAATVSSRLGDVDSTIDLAIELSSDAIAKATAAVNELVLDDRPIHILFPKPDEVAGLGLRRDPKVTADIRVIDVEGFDRSPCGGTHCARTGQIGPVVVTGAVRHKGGTRVTFVAGARALDDHLKKDATLSSLARDFSCGLHDVPVAVAKLRRELDARTEALGSVRAELARLVAREALAALPADDRGPRAVVVVRAEADVPSLRTIAAELARRTGIVALACGLDTSTNDHAVVVERGTVTAFDAGAWLKAAAKAHGGRGGGRAERAEGRLPVGASPVELAASIDAALHQ